MKHRLAILGCGGMESNHEPAFADLKDRVEVVACVDPIIERAEHAASVLGGVAARDVSEVLDRCDMVLGVLPHHLHHSIGLQCLRAGKHVLMEKPLANTEEQCLELQAEADARGLTLMTAYPMRYHPLVRELKRLIDERAYGDVFHMSIWTEQYTRPEPGHWCTTKEGIGGGQFFSHGCHYVDLLLWFLGRPTHGMHLGNRVGTPWLEGEGTSDVVLQFENGVLGYHGGTWGAKGTRLKYAIHAQCTDGMLELDFMGGELRLLHGDDETVLARHSMVKNVLGELTEFLDAVDEGREPETGAQQSIEGLRVIWALYGAEESHTLADLRGLVTHPGFQGPPPASETATAPLEDNRTDVYAAG